MAQLPYMLGPNFQELRRLVAKDDFELQTQIRNTLRLLEPQKVKGHRKARFGSANDGGYVHLDDFEGVDTALSLGIDHNINWDKDVADRGLTVYQFDYGVDDPAPDDPRMAFFKVMIGPNSGPGVETLETLVERFDKKRERPNILLKMDIECAEWTVIEATSLDTIARFSQITCELHNFQGLSHEGWRQTCFRALRKLAKFYAPIHVHANNCADFTIIAGVPVPEILEVTFANRALYEFEDSDEVFPTELDAPCNPNRPDLFLGAFRFQASTETRPSAAGNDNAQVPDEWKARAEAATERRQRLLSFGPRAAGLLVASQDGPLVVDAEDSSVGAILLEQGSYADHEYELARSLIRPEGNALIVGAHIGAHVVRLAKHCRELIAIEANPRTFSLLEANVRLQNSTNVRLLNLAAGEKAGKIEFLQNRDNTGGSKRKPVHDQFYYSYDNPEIIEVDCARLDDILPEDKNYDLIFMDIEGSEFFALQGMQSILGRTNALSLEFLTHHLRDVAAVSADQLSELIMPHFAWMFIPGRNEFVQGNEIGPRMRQMHASGENHDCLYFLKELDSAWLANRGLTDPRTKAQAETTV